MSTKSETDRLNQLKDFWRDAEEPNDKLYRRMTENFQFAIGHQWSSSDIAALDEMGKPHLTYNEILPKLNVLVGEYLDNMFEPVCYGRRSGTTTGAGILTALLKHIMDLCNGTYEEAECFLDGITGGVGNIAYEKDYTNDPFNGDVITRRISPFNIRWDWLDNEYNPDKKGQFVIEQWYWSEDELILTYPKKERDIKGGGLDFGGSETFYGDRSEQWPQEEQPRGGEQKYDESHNIVNGIRKKGSVCVRCYLWKSHEKILYLLDKQNPLKPRRMMNDKSKELAKTLVNMNPAQYSIREIVGPVLHKTTQAGNLILEDIENPLGETAKFNIKRFCPYWFDGYPLGVVDNLIDPQREINKRMSQVLHIINTTASRLWLNKDKVGADPEELAEMGSKTGGVVNYKEVIPVQTDAPTLPTGHAQLAEMNSTKLTEISGVPIQLEGRSESPNESGVANQLKQLRGIKMAKPIFAKMNLTRQYLYEGIVEMVQKSDVYSLDEIRELVDKEDLVSNEIRQQVIEIIGEPPQEPQQPDPQALQALQQLNPEQAAIDIPRATQAFKGAVQQYVQQKRQYDQTLQLKAEQLLYEQITSLDFGRYGIKISSGPSNPTMRLAYFQMLLEARKAGLMIPDDVIYEASDWPDKIKNKLLERYKQMAQAAQMQAQQPQMEMAGAGK